MANARAMSKQVSKPLRYHLRFQVIPGKNVEKDARILINFCKTHGIEEVVLFFAAEEWNNGLLSMIEEDIWFDTVEKVKRIIDKAGIVVSLNPWMTVLHFDRGRKFPKGRKFKPMVSPAGEVSKACASFADVKWRSYIYNLYGRFAKLGFRIIWVEDDFRYHNHAPLTWGGGFEPEILDRFGQKVGRKVMREEVVKNILKSGKPHPWRVKWMETWREIQLEVANGLSRAVAGNMPANTKIGLMSSHPDDHSIEGRDWTMLFNAFSINSKAAHRPHFAQYGESPGKDKIYSIMMLDVQKNFRPANCEAAPEIENGYFTNWTKSDSLTWAEMAFCMFYGSDALLLDLFPFSGNTANEEPEIGKLLDKSRPALEWISARFPKNLKTCGVGIPWREDAQAHVHTDKGKSMEELNATFLEPCYYLLSYGIPVSANQQKVNAIFGQLAWAFDDDEIQKMLSYGLFLDGVSAVILCQRGFGQHIGIDSKGLIDREEGKYSVEMVISKETCIRERFFLNANTPSRMAILEPRKGAREWTTIITPEQKRFGAGIVVYENKLGGRVATCAAANPMQLPQSYQRQAITQKVIDFLAGDKFVSVMVTGGPHLMPIHFEGENRHFVVVFNGSPDTAKPVVRIGSARTRHMKAYLLAPLKKPSKARVNIVSTKNAATVRSQTGIPYLGFLMLEW